MQNLTIKEYSKAEDLSNVVLRDETTYGVDGFRPRAEVALVVLTQRIHTEFANSDQDHEFVLITTNVPPLEDTVLLSDALTANGIRVPLPEPGVYQVYTFAVPRMANIYLYPGGSMEIGKIYYDATIGELVRIVSFTDIEMTDEYAQTYGYIDLPDLLAAEQVATDANNGEQVYLVPRFSYQTEIEVDPYTLLDSEYDHAITHILSQKRLREIAASWWYYIYKNRRGKKLCNDEMYDYMAYVADLEGACARFEGGYFSDAAEIMDALISRGIEINDSIKY